MTKYYETYFMEVLKKGTLILLRTMKVFRVNGRLGDEWTVLFFGVV